MEAGGAAPVNYSVSSSQTVTTGGDAGLCGTGAYQAGGGGGGFGAGGGGGGYGSDADGGSGGAGGYVRIKTITISNPSASIACKIGEGGAGGKNITTVSSSRQTTYSRTNGTNGGTTSFGSYLSASGGEGGKTSGVGNTNVPAEGGSKGGIGISGIGGGGGGGFQLGNWMVGGDGTNGTNRYAEKRPKPDGCAGAGGVHSLDYIYGGSIGGGGASGQDGYCYLKSYSGKTNGVILLFW